MWTHKIFDASLLLVIVILQCFGPCHQLSLQERSTNKFPGHELVHLGERSRFKRSTYNETKTEDDDNTKLIGGVPADETFILSLQTKQSGRHFCGATIIASHLALTAAHCFDNIPNPALAVRAVAGERDLRTKHGSEQVRGIKRVHIHENYTPELENDIALIELDEPLILARRVVEKIEWKTWPTETFAGEEATAFGWGWTGKGFSQILQKVNLPILANSACRRQFASTNHTITSSMLCAGQVGLGKDTCSGDSGGPLTVDYTLVGIVSWGLGCAMDHAGVYTRVNAYIPWIESKMYL